MPSSSSQQRATARRALIADISADRKGWLQHGIAALGVSLLGLGVAASVSLTGAAQGTTAHPAPVVKAAESAVAAENDTAPNPRLAARGGSADLDANRLKSLADQRAEELAEASEDYAIAASTTSADARDKSLKDQAAEARAAAKRLAAQGTTRTTRPDYPSSTPAPSRATARPACPWPPTASPPGSGRSGSGRGTTPASTSPPRSAAPSGRLRPAW